MNKYFRFLKIFFISFIMVLSPFPSIVNSNKNYNYFNNYNTYALSEEDAVEFLGFDRNILFVIKNAQFYMDKYVKENMKKVQDYALSYSKKIIYLSNIYDIIKFYGGTVFVSKSGLNIINKSTSYGKNLFNSIIEKISKKQFDVKLYSDFKEAQKEYDKLKTNADKINKSIVSILEFSPKIESLTLSDINSDQFESDLKTWQAIIAFRAKNLEDDLIDLRSNKVCWIEKRKELTNSQEVTKVLENIQSIIKSEQRIDICSTLKKMNAELTNIRFVLEDYRAKIIAAKDVFFKNIFQKTKIQDDKLKRLFSDIRNNGTKFIESSTENNLANLKKIHNVWIKNCIQELKSRGRKELTQQWDDLRLKSSTETVVGSFKEDPSSFFLDSSYKEAICEKQFDILWGKEYLEREKFILTEKTQLIDIHQRYQKEIEKNYLLFINRGPTLIKEDMVNLEKYFKEILSEQSNTSEIDNLLKQKEKIEHFCKILKK
ncbi:MAG: hypothetical protein HQK51_19605 [Oligoflexia bacterium]|nr:hypothetical protein [Oligoflexia bacterium]